MGSNGSSLIGQGGFSRCLLLGGDSNRLIGDKSATNIATLATTSCTYDNTNVVGSGNCSRCAIIAGLSNTISVSEGGVDSGTVISCTGCGLSRTSQCCVIAGSTTNVSGTGLKSRCLASGSANQITGSFPVNDSAILGGTLNVITNSTGGTSSSNTIIGGNSNTISGTTINSIACCQNATAAHSNCFVFSNGNTPISSSVQNQWTVKSTAGSRFYSNDAATTGVTLAAGGSSWASVCDENVKENQVLMNGSDYLDGIMNIPCYKYNYIGNDTTQYCYGPCAQDYHAEFPSTKDQYSIEVMDLVGILMACVQQLNTNLMESQSNSSFLEANLNTSNTNNISLQGNLDESNSTITDLQASIALLKNRMDLMESQSQSQNSVIDQFSSRLTDFDYQIQDFNTKLNEMEKDIDSIQTDINVIKEDIQELHSNASTSINSILSLQSTVNSCNSNIATLQTGLTTCNSNIVKLNTNKLGISIF